MASVSRCHRLHMKTHIINESEESRLSMMIHVCLEKDPLFTRGKYLSLSDARSRIPLEPGNPRV